MVAGTVDPGSAAKSETTPLFGPRCRMLALDFQDTVLNAVWQFAAMPNCHRPWRRERLWYNPWWAAKRSRQSQKFGRLAQLVKSAILTRWKSLVRVQCRPLENARRKPLQVKYLRWFFRLPTDRKNPYTFASYTFLYTF